MANKYKILERFYNEDRLRFNELLGEFSSNVVSYHLKKFLTEGLVVKDGDYYFLTDKGERLICRLDKGRELGVIEQPIHDVLLFAFDGKKYLFQRRTKAPFKGVLGPIGAKIRSGESIFETAEKKLLKDAGLSGDFKYKGVIDVRTRKDGKLFLHHILNVFLVENLKGDFVEKTDKGENFWLSERAYFGSEGIMSGMKEHFEIVKWKGFMFLDLEQEMRGEKFIGVRVVRKQKF